MMFSTRRRINRWKGSKFNFLGSGIELFSSDLQATNQKISFFPDQNGFGELMYSAKSNLRESIWIGYIDRAEYIEVPLSVLSKKAMDHEWVEVRILRELVSLGHPIKGADVLVEIRNYGTYQTRFMESVAFIKGLNEILHLNIQPSKIIAIVERALGKNYGKRHSEFYGVFSTVKKQGQGVKGKGLFSFSSKNPLLPLLFYSKRGFNVLSDQGLVEFDIDELGKSSRENWSEFLSPMEESSLSFFLGIGDFDEVEPARELNSPKKRTSRKVHFAA
jgi:hypothetical protein